MESDPHKDIEKEGIVKTESYYEKIKLDRVEDAQEFWKDDMGIFLSCSDSLMMKPYKPLIGSFYSKLSRCFYINEPMINIYEN